MNGGIGQDYSGDVSAREAWDLLAKTQDATLIDVRTRAEWSFVGIPELTDLGKDVVFVEWQTFPERALNPGFVDALSAELSRRNIGPDAPLLFLCRSGGRSASAARAVTAAGRDHCYNVAGGFEGGLDGERHRGRMSGWKAQNLPWVQT
jgi:rhodanese-related sulfurtransferase